ncbi:MAG: potassium channel protein [Deltaproteobacteria bacterium]|nr:potassium channel protein [Deltaproteobacteria bacterium]
MALWVGAARLGLGVKLRLAGWHGSSRRRARGTGYGGGALDQAFYKHMRRMWTAAVFLLMVVMVGTAGYWWLGDGRWDWGDCAYMTLITLSTVGFGETLPGMDGLGLARLWTVLLILLGSGTLLYFASTLTALIVEGDLGGVLRRNRMSGKISQMRGHFVVVGAGRTGVDVIRELIATHTPFVAVDNHEKQLLAASAEVGREFPYVVGSAEDDEVLRAAGIADATGLAAALPDDRDNLFLTLSARALNDKLRIVAKAVEPASVPKLYRAGANSVVSTTHIGAMRMSSELIRPQVVEFLDVMLRNMDKDVRVSQLLITPGSNLAGRRLSEVGVYHGQDLVVMAVRRVNGEYVHVPPKEMLLEAGAHLIVLGSAAAVQRWQHAIDRSVR